MKIQLKAAISGLLFVCIANCTSQGNKVPAVTVYVSADEHIAREVFAAFTKATGIDVLWVGDTEASKTTALVNRLHREKDDPIADVFWSSEILGTIQLANAGILSPHHSAIGDAWPDEHRDAQFRWFGFSPRARVIVFDPSRIDTSELPSTWWELSEAAMADPRFGTTGTHLAVMAGFPDQFSSFLDSIKGNPLLGGNAATVQAVVDGTVLLAMTDTDDVHAAVQRGATIAMYFPRHHDGSGGGTLLIPNTIGIIRGCEHPTLAASFVDYMLSDEVATLLANSPSRNIPLQPSVAMQFPDLAVEDPLKVDFYAAAARQNEVIQRVMDAIASNNEK